MGTRTMHGFQFPCSDLILVRKTAVGSMWMSTLLFLPMTDPWDDCTKFAIRKINQMVHLHIAYMVPMGSIFACLVVRKKNTTNMSTKYGGVSWRFTIVELRKKYLNKSYKCIIYIYRTLSPIMLGQLPWFRGNDIIMEKKHKFHWTIARGIANMLLNSLYSIGHFMSLATCLLLDIS